MPGQKVPSVTSGELGRYLKTVVAPQVYIKDEIASSLDEYNLTLFEYISLVIRSFA